MKTGMDKQIANGAWVALCGYLLSGPVGFILVNWLQPQPAWVSPSVFAANYHWLQDVPYYFGFLLVGGMLMIFAANYLRESLEHLQLKFFSLLAMLAAIVFATLIAFNYICQTTFIRQLAVHYDETNDPSIATFSMANPASLSWSVEMWGYGFLGIATWLLAPVYKKRSNLVSILLQLNGIVSVVGVLLTIVDARWVLTGYGLLAYAAWNLLMILLMILIHRNATQSTDS